jgi:hypothetical protein
MKPLGMLLIGAAAGTWAVQANAATIYGEAQKLGSGVARLFAELDGAGAPQAIGVSFDQGMLEDLPAMPNSWSRCFDKDGDGKIAAHGECNGDYELEFALPPELVELTPFRWVGVNYNPMGHPHPAPPVWAVPHYDFHFYLMEREAVRQIRPGACSELLDCADFARAHIPVPARYVHADHIDVGAAVPDMGNHLIDSRSPELDEQGRDFTHTFIVGAYDGQVTFYEPMITLAYLASSPAPCTPIKQPAAFETAGWYPTTYCIRHPADAQRYPVALEDFVRRDAD